MYIVTMTFLPVLYIVTMTFLPLLYIVTKTFLPVLYNHYHHSATTTTNK